MWETWLDSYDEVPRDLEDELAYYRFGAAAWDAVASYFGDRLKSFFLAHPDAIAPAHESLQLSFSLLDKHFYAASVVFAFSSVEIMLRRGLIEPIILGSIVTDPLAKLVSALLQRQSLPGMRELVFSIFREAGIELDKYKPAGFEQTVWDSIMSTRDLRNRIVHVGATANHEDASGALMAAAELTESMFPKVVASFGLHLDAGPRICDSYPCTQPRWTPNKETA